MMSRTTFDRCRSVVLIAVLGPALVLAGLALVEAQAPVPQETALGSGFSYQGLLTDSDTGEPIAGPCDLRFGLYESQADNDPVSPLQVEPKVLPDNGYFSVDLDFGSAAFSGEARYLEIEVDCGDGYATLSPRVNLQAVPYALHATGNWSLAGNSGTSAGAHFLGTTDSQALELHVNGARALRLEPKATSPNVIGGHGSNSVTAPMYGGTIGGGGEVAATNTVTNHFGTVAGGAGNTAGYRATVAGGWHNTADNQGSVGGGWWNEATGPNSAVGGGGYNTASAEDAVIAGGSGNEARANGAVVSGGSSNDAIGYHALVAGGYDNVSGPGYGTTVSGGHDNVASQDAATVGGGELNTASGIGATVGGGGANDASGFGATIPGGLDAKASGYGQMAYAAGQFASPGDAQSSLYVLRLFTSASGTWENLYLDGSSRLLTIVPTRTLTYDVQIVGLSAGGESAGYHCEGVIESSSEGTTLYGGSCNELYDESGGWEATVIAGELGQALLVQVKGTGEDVRWVATVRTTEVGW